jgi:hypothetical protein
MSGRDKLWELFVRRGPGLRTWSGQVDELALHGVVLPADITNLNPGERFNYAVCLPLDREYPLQFPDNRRGRCSECNCRIQHRPNLPRRVPRVCVSCAVRIIRGDA